MNSRRMKKAAMRYSVAKTCTRSLRTTDFKAAACSAGRKHLAALERAQQHGFPLRLAYRQKASAGNSNRAIHRWGALLPGPCHRQGRAGAIGSSGLRPGKNRQVSLIQFNCDELDPVQFAQGAQTVQQRRMFVRGTIPIGVGLVLIRTVMRTDMPLQQVRRL